MAQRLNNLAGLHPEMHPLVMYLSINTSNDLQKKKKIYLVLIIYIVSIRVLIHPPPKLHLVLVLTICL